MSILDIFFPRSCAICGSRLADGERDICLSCTRAMSLTDDFCSPLDNPTARRLWGRCDVERAVALARFYPHTRFATAIYRMKYNNHPEIGEAFGRLAASILARHGFFDGIDLLIPLPLHKQRERERGYNQSLEIARGIAIATHIPICHDNVTRSRYTVSQTTVSPDTRTKNVEGAFCVRHPEEISSRHILLIDDIITTGASLSTCAREIQSVADVTTSFFTIGRTEM